MVPCSAERGSCRGAWGLTPTPHPEELLKASLSGRVAHNCSRGLETAVSFRLCCSGDLQVAICLPPVISPALSLPKRPSGASGGTSLQSRWVFVAPAFRGSCVPTGPGSARTPLAYLACPERSEGSGGPAFVISFLGGFSVGAAFKVCVRRYALGRARLPPRHKTCNRSLVHG